MFQRARLRLTAWYVAFLAVILILFDAGVLTLMSRSLQSNLDDDLQRKAAQASTAILDVGGTPYFDKAQIGSDPSWADVSLYASTSSGAVIQSANTVSEAILPDRRAISAALAGSAGFTMSGSGRDAFVIYSQPIYRKDITSVSGPDVIGVVQVARSGRTLADTLTGLESLVIAATLLALLVAFFAGLWLAGKALNPIRVSLLKQKQFISDASHELRTPVTVIQTAAEAVLRQKEGVSPEVAGLAEDIMSETRQLSGLVSDLGTLVQADDRVAMRQEPVEVAELFAAASQAGRLLAQARHVSLESSLDGTGIILGDPVRLRQLLTILLDNATKFGPDGSAVSLAGEVSEHKLTVRVTDAGPGIAPEEMARIFERFYRGPGHRREEGSGLGLAIAQWIAEVHGGTIAVRSVPGQGAEFSVEIPLATASAADGAVPSG